MPKRLPKQYHILKRVHVFSSDREHEKIHLRRKRGTTWCNRNGYLDTSVGAIICDEARRYVCFITDRDPTCANCIKMKQRTEEKLNGTVT